MSYTKHALLAGCLLLGPAVAWADDPQPAPSSDTTATTNVTVVTPPAPAPATQPPPPAPAPAVPGVVPPVEQAGVGSTVGYARAGVLELGGFFGLNAAQNVRDLNFSPQVGWFLVDNLELSGIVSVSNIKAGMDETTMWSALVEPSLHLPFNRDIFGFAGLGVGAAYISSLGSGMAIAPRIGMNMLIGRSGILSPSLTYEYTTHNTSTMTDSTGNQNVTLVAVSSALRVNVGYTVMW